MNAAVESRRFLVHPAHDRGEGHVVADAADFQDAAFSFIERWSPAPEGDQNEIRLVVCDCETGREECFCILLGSDEAQAVEWDEVEPRRRAVG